KPVAHPVYFQTGGNPHAHHRADGRVHSRRVAAAGEHRNASQRHHLVYPDGPAAALAAVPAPPPRQMRRPAAPGKSSPSRPAKAPAAGPAASVNGRARAWGQYLNVRSTEDLSILQTRARRGKGIAGRGPPDRGRASAVQHEHYQEGG